MHGSSELARPSRGTTSDAQSWLDECYESILRVAERVATRAKRARVDSMDLAHDASLLALQSSTDFGELAAPQVLAWFGTTMKHLCFKHVRTDTRAARAFRDLARSRDSVAADAAASGALRSEWQELCDRLPAGLDRLEPTQLALVRRVFLGGEEIRLVAEDLGLDRRWECYRVLSRALDRLRRELRRPRDQRVPLGS